MKNLVTYLLTAAILITSCNAFAGCCGANKKDSKTCNCPVTSRR